MKPVATLVITASVGWGLSAQAPVVIDRDSGNRLPIVKRESLDEASRALYDESVRGMQAGTSLAGLRGPGGINLYSPPVAQADNAKVQYWRNAAHLGRRSYELAVLVTARELDQQFEWTAHEGAALRSGVPQAAVDAVKFRRPADGLDEKDRLVVEIGRQLYRTRKVDEQLFARARSAFGDRDLVDLISIMGQYAATAVLLNAFDQQLPPGQSPLLPIP
jgi:4-carboxymuconolactone decarboxylase